MVEEIIVEDTAQNREIFRDTGPNSPDRENG
jgi:hypothetical protein